MLLPGFFQSTRQKDESLSAATIVGSPAVVALPLTAPERRDPSSDTLAGGALPTLHLKRYRDCTLARAKRCASWPRGSSETVNSGSTSTLRTSTSLLIPIVFPPASACSFPTPDNTGLMLQIPHQSKAQNSKATVSFNPDAESGTALFGDFFQNKPVAAFPVISL